MLVGSTPYYAPRRKELFLNIASAPLNFPEHVSQPACSLVRSLMHRDPTQRLGADRTFSIRKHPFFATIDWDALMRREVPAPQVSSPWKWWSSRSSSTSQSPFDPEDMRPSWDQGLSVAGWDFSSPTDVIPESPISRSNSRFTTFWGSVADDEPLASQAAPGRKVEAPVQQIPATPRLHTPPPSKVCQSKAPVQAAAAPNAKHLSVPMSLEAMPIMGA
jgi:serine/threonine protein kinase